MTLPLALWLHDLDKMAVHIPWLPNGGIAWYGLSYLAGFIIAWLLVRRVMGAGATPLGVPLAKDAAADLIMTCAMGVLIGGRLGYCVFYKPHLWVEFSGDLPFWGVLAIHQGGMASHGGMIGAGLATAWWARKHKVPVPYLLDLIGFAAPLGLCCGRLANFVNGELYGRACDASYRFAVLFPQEVAEDPKKYEALAARIGPVPADLGMAAKADPELAAILREPGMLTPRHPSQLYAAAAEGLAVFLILFIAYRKPRKPGFIAGLFALAYTAARVGDEFFRMPDAQFIKNGNLPSVTQGQLLSFFLLAAGIGLVAWSWKSEGKALGGWGKTAGQDKA